MLFLRISIAVIASAVVRTTVRHDRLQMHIVLESDP